ncbi:tyrosyl-DNA phosphodiesterase 1 isoform X2 [Phragmites australis]|uniref:tyrosyl-DNA phosphodiesterase 1 isoform X2 n=1 Tax=Phragmites australis TaxID=29695 RepID=UPI002D77165F|nr:tyrosyl-DNA phosphodiesterase 1 isoform X2 [Phragmites australis]
MASASRVRVGTLVPLVKDNAGSSNGSVSSIPIFEGSNVIGRNHLVVVDKRVSRKHLSLHASADGSIDVVVEGPNPIVVRSEGQRRKVCAQEKAKITHDDVLELIPGDYFVKYVDMADEHRRSVPIDLSGLKKGKRHSEEDSAAVKRNRQIMEDEALARTLQESIAEESTTVSDMASGQTLSPLDSAGSSKRSNERIHSVGPLKDVLSLTFRLMRVQGLPSWANTSSVTVQDVIQGEVLLAVLSDYMVDIDWLLTACPSLRRVPHVLVIHGEDGASLELLKKLKPANWILHKPPLPISFGTHHSKAMLLVYPQGIRVVVHTANMIYVDWNNKSQGLWMQDFPWKDAKDINKKIPFENDLVDYLSALKWPEFRVNLPVVGDVNINAAFFRKFDYSSSMVRLIGSVPGYHVGPNIKKWGHMKLRSILEECMFEKQFCKSPLIYQFSSLGSLDEKWMSEFTYSLSAGKSDDGSPLGIGKPLIVWPTVEDVRCSIESCYASYKNFYSLQWSKYRMVSAYLIKFKQSCLGCAAEEQYTAHDTLIRVRCIVPAPNSPVCTTIFMHGEESLKPGSSKSFIIRESFNYLCANLSLSSHFLFYVYTQGSLVVGEKIKTKLVTLCWKGDEEKELSTEIVRLPVPYQLPPQPYGSEDVPWSWDRRYTKKDVYGSVWPHHG